jgi:hypothetical protein
MSRRHAVAAETASIAGWIVASVATVAVLVRVTAAEPTRRWLDFPFAGVDPSVKTAISIFLNNARMVFGVVAGSALIQSRWCKRVGSDRPAVGVLAVSLLDTLFVLVATSNIVIVGASLGAYGERMATTMLPHGPLELAAFAAAVSLYRQARRGHIPTRQLTVAAVACLGLLLAAALLETYVRL